MVQGDPGPTPQQEGPAPAPARPAHPSGRELRAPDGRGCSQEPASAPLRHAQAAGCTGSFQYFPLNSKYMFYALFSADDVFPNKKNFNILEIPR